MIAAEQRRTRLYWVAAAMLMVVAAGLIVRLRAQPMDNDEIWEIWQSFGTPQQIITWTSPSEYPTYNLLLSIWKDAAGFHPYILHYLTILLALPGIAITYRAVRRLSGEWAGILAALAYSVFPISIFMSLQARSYVFVYSALPLALWLSSRYLEKPTIKRGLLAGFTLYLMYIGNVSIIPALGLFALYLLIVYPKRILYGILPAVVGVALVLPDYLSNKLTIVSNFGDANVLVKVAPLPQAWFDFFNFYAGTVVWYALAIAAAFMAIIMLRRFALERKQRVMLLFWLGWLILIPLILYVLEPKLGFYPPRRYGWWYVFGIALLVGMSLSHLPRLGRWAVAGVFVVMTFTPFHLSTYNFIVTPLGDDMSWLRDHIQAHDSLLIDPAVTCYWPEEWDYYTRLYFPEGINLVTQPEGTERLWYVASENDASRAYEQQLSQTRMPGRFVGPPGCLMRMYEAPPDPTGILFENGMRFHGFQVMSDDDDGDKPLDFPLVYRETQPMRVRLWWSVDQPVTQDYSVSLMLQLKGAVYGQSDSGPELIYPQGGPSQTSQWKPGQIYVEERTLMMPPSNYRRIFDLMLMVYWYGDPSHRFSASGETPDGSLPLTKVTMVAW